MCVSESPIVIRFYLNRKAVVFIPFNIIVWNVSNIATSYIYIRENFCMFTPKSISFQLGNVYSSLSDT